MIGCSTWMEQRYVGQMRVPARAWGMAPRWMAVKWVNFASVRASVSRFDRGNSTKRWAAERTGPEEQFSHTQLIRGADGRYLCHCFWSSDFWAPWKEGWSTWQKNEWNQWRYKITQPLEEEPRQLFVFQVRWFPSGRPWAWLRIERVVVCGSAFSCVFAWEA